MLATAPPIPNPGALSSTVSSSLSSTGSSSFGCETLTKQLFSPLRSTYLNHHAESVGIPTTTNTLDPGLRGPGSIFHFQQKVLLTLSKNCHDWLHTVVQSCRPRKPVGDWMTEFPLSQVTDMVKGSVTGSPTGRIDSQRVVA